MIDLEEEIKRLVSKNDAIIRRINLLVEKLNSCENALSDAESERDELKAKLAEMENNSADVLPFVAWSKEDEFFASQPMYNNSAPSKRITEQDARDE